MTNKDIVNPDPKGQFLVDLEVFIKKRRILDEGIILAVDANEPLIDVSRPEKLTGISKLLKNCCLTDVFENMHEGGCGNTSDKKNHKIDHIAVSEAILPAAKRCGFFSV